MDEQNNIAEVNLSKYRFDGSWDWYHEASRKFGADTTLQMCVYLDEMAKRLKVGAYIDIPKLVKNPAKLEFVVKIACVVCVSATRMATGPFFEMNKTYTKLIRVA